MKTLTANEIFKKAFNGRKITGTKIVKRGKINKTLAFEIAQHNTPYTDYTKCWITIIDVNDVDVIDKLKIKKIYDDFALAYEVVKNIKNNSSYKKLYSA